MLYICACFFTILGLINKKSNKLMLAIIILLLILMAGNTYNADSIVYNLNYDNITNPLYTWPFEDGYQYFAKLCATIGLTYNQFLFVVGLIALTLIVNTIKLFTPYKTYVLALYFVYPFIIDVVQIRNFLAMSIIVFGMRYLIAEKKNYMKYTLCVLIASVFHISSIFYMVFLLVRIKDIRKLYFLSIGTTITSILFMNKILLLLSYFIPVEKIIAYTQTETSTITKLFVIFYYIVSFVLVKSGVDQIKKSNLKENKLNTFVRRYKYSHITIKEKIINLDSEAVLKINIISLLGLYFFMNNLNFIRIYRNLYLVYYILFSVALFEMKKLKKYYIYYIGILMFVLVSAIIFNGIIPTSNIIKDVFENNVILR